MVFVTMFRVSAMSLSLFLKVSFAVFKNKFHFFKNQLRDFEKSVARCKNVRFAILKISCAKIKISCRLLVCLLRISKSQSPCCGTYTKLLKILTSS